MLLVHEPAAFVGRANTKRTNIWITDILTLLVPTVWLPLSSGVGFIIQFRYIWITDMANFAEMNAIWDAWVSPGNTPARGTVEAKLASPDYKVEMMVVAAR